MIRAALYCVATGIAGLVMGATIRPVFAQEGGSRSLTVADFPDLGKGLRDTPGCLGVSTASVDGKLVIFAWFENKRAVDAWYHSKMHVEAMRKFFPAFSPKSEALPLMKDAKAPVLMVASVTPGSKAGIAGSPLAVDQIAIEAYTPVPGGVAYGKTFAPEGLKVPGMMRLSSSGIDHPKR